MAAAHRMTGIDRGDDGMGHVLDAAQAALSQEFSRAERLDTKARGQLTLAGSWFAVVQAVAAVAIKTGIDHHWLFAVGGAALGAGAFFVVLFARSIEVWKLRDEKVVDAGTLYEMSQARDDPELESKMVEMYRVLLESAQEKNANRAKALDKTFRPMAISLVLALAELGFALLARLSVA